MAVKVRYNNSWINTKLTEEQLETYFDFWKNGASDADLMTVTGLSRAKYIEYQPFFLSYTRDRSAHDSSVSLAGNRGPLLLALTHEREEQFLANIASGMSYSESALDMGVPVPTVLDYWMKNQQFQERVVNATKIATSKVVKALYKKAVGAKSVATKVITHTAPNGSTLSTQEIVTSTDVCPDINAIRFWLTNKAPEEWKNTEQVSVTGKGKILEYLEGLTEIDDAKTQEIEAEQKAYLDKHHAPNR